MQYQSRKIGLQQTRKQVAYGIVLMSSLAILTLLTPILKKSFNHNLNQASAAAPAVTSVTSSSGPIAGGNTVTIRGNNFERNLVFTQISAGERQTCGVANGRAFCWGHQVDFTEIPRGAIPAGASITTIATGVDHQCVLTAVTEDHNTFCWGGNTHGQVGNDTTAYVGAPILIGSFRQISAGASYTCATDRYNQGFCWGNNSNSKLGYGTPGLNYLVPKKLEGISFYSITTGPGHTTCGVGVENVNQGGGFAHCWGSNNYNQIGISGGNQTSPAKFGGSNFGFYAYNSVAVTGGTNCIKDGRNYIHCSGYGGNGEIGNGSVTNQRTPVELPVTANRLSGGGSLDSPAGFFCADTADGWVSCWGYNGSGQLGNNTAISHSVPTSVSRGAIPAGVTLSGVEAGNSHACAIGSDGNVYCWGDNYFRQLGSGTNTPSNVPVKVQTGSFVPRVTIGGIAATNVNVVNATTITATVPARATPGPVNVVVSNPGGEASTLTNGYTYYTVPATPATPTATPGNAQVALSWTAPSNNYSAINGYVIQYKLSTSGTWLTFSNNTSTATSITVTGLTNGSSYDFRVAAKNAAGTGSYSTAVNATLRTVPAAPTMSVSSLTVASNTQFSLAWSIPTNGGSPITDYVVQVGSTPSGPWVALTPSVTTNQITLTSSNTPGIYYYAVVARNAVGEGPISNATMVTVASPPSTPTNLTATPGLDSVILNWTAPSNNGGSPITDYRIEYCTATSAGVCTGAWTTYNDGISTNTTTTVSGLGSSATAYYNFRVSAINLAGTSTPSSAVTAQASYITLSTSTSTVTLNVRPSGTSASLSSTNHNLTINTNNPAGYNITLAMLGTNQNLIHADPLITTNNTISPTISSFTNPILDLPVNTWGYRLNTPAFNHQGSLTDNTTETNTTTVSTTGLRSNPVLHQTLSSKLPHHLTKPYQSIMALRLMLLSQLVPILL